VPQKPRSGASSARSEMNSGQPTSNPISTCSKTGSVNPLIFLVKYSRLLRDVRRISVSRASCLVPTPQSASEVVAAVASARLRLHGFYGGCKGTTLFRPLVAVVGSVLPSGAGVDGDTTVGNHLLRVTGRS
jgi:hypothetical protein